MIAGSRGWWVEGDDLKLRASAVRVGVVPVEEHGDDGERADPKHHHCDQNRPRVTPDKDPDTGSSFPHYRIPFSSEIGQLAGAVAVVRMRWENSLT